MTSTGTDDFENGWTLVDKDGQIDIEVSLSLFQLQGLTFSNSSSRNNEYCLKSFVLST